MALGEAWLAGEIKHCLQEYGRCEVDQHVLEEVIPPDAPMGASEVMENLMLLVSNETPRRMPPEQYSDKITRFADRHGWNWRVDPETRHVHFELRTRPGGSP